MEGNGPVDGTAVKMNVALGGMNAISVDSIASKLIGLEPFEIGYLDHIIKYEDFDPENILIIGNTTVDKEKRKLKLHDKVKSQLCWK